MYQKLKKPYLYIEMLDTKEEQMAAYKNIVLNFINNGVRIVDLDYDTLRMVAVFGASNAFFAQDIHVLCEFCKAILTLQNNFCDKHQGTPMWAEIFPGNENYHQRFADLVRLCKKLFAKIAPDKHEEFYHKFKQRNEAYEAVLREKERLLEEQRRLEEERQQ